MKKEQQIFTQVNTQNVPVSADILDTLEQEELHEILLRKYLVEKSLRGKRKAKRLLYHIGNRPASPKPISRPDEQGWRRYWLDKDVKSGVFFSPNPIDIAQYHGIGGDIYAYKIPEWVIAQAGGVHRYDHGSEVLVSAELWKEAGDEIEFLGKSMAEEELWDKIESLGAEPLRRSSGSRPGWMSEDEWERASAIKARESHLSGLRSTKHPKNAIQMMKPEELKSALNAFETIDSPREKDREIIDLLKSYMNEAVIREYARALLREISMSSAVKVAGAISTGKAAYDKFSPMYQAIVDTYSSMKAPEVSVPSTPSVAEDDESIEDEDELNEIEDEEVSESVVRLQIRELLLESTKYDSKFKTLMDAGYDGIKDAMFLADSLGIPPRQLPWDKKLLDKYVYNSVLELPAGIFNTHDPQTYDIASEKSLNAIGWTRADWINIGGNHHMHLQRALGLRESADYGDGDSMSDKEKIIMLFFRESSRMGIQMAEMTPGLESLVADLDDFRDLVDGFVDKAERLVRSQGKYQERNQYTISDLMSLHRQIQYGMFKLTNQLISRKPSAAMSKWANELFLLVGGIQTAISSYSVGWNDEMQTKLDDLKDWARET